MSSRTRLECFGEVCGTALCAWLQGRAGGGCGSEAVGRKDSQEAMVGILVGDDVA